jgi:hypothetical protein
MTKFILSVLISSYFGLAQAGTAVSGGGGAFVCRDNNTRNITQAMLVDLWESQNTPFAWPGGGFHGDQTISIFKNNDISVTDQITKALQNLKLFNSDLEGAVNKELTQIRLVMNPLPKGISLTIPNDLQVDYFPEGCAPEGMLRYNGYSKKLDVKTDIFEKLESNTDVAAAYIHEAIYKVFRDGFDEAQNSIMARRLVACLFSEECVQGSLKTDEQLFPADVKVYECQSEDADYQIYQTPPTSTGNFGDDSWNYKIRRIKDLTFGVPVNGVANFNYCIGNKCVADKNNTLDPLKNPGGWFETFGFHPLQTAQFEITHDAKFDIATFAAKQVYSSSSERAPKLIAESASAKCKRIQ